MIIHETGSYGAPEKMPLFEGSLEIVKNSRNPANQEVNTKQKNSEKSQIVIEIEKQRA